MRQLKTINSRKICFVTILNIIVILVSFLVFKPFFEENDDLFLSMICEGVFGKPDYHLIYSNTILGRIFVALQTIFPMLRSFVVVQYFFVFFALISIGSIIVKRKNGLFWTLVLSVGTFYELYVSFQYTKTAAFLAIAGYILLFEATKISKENSQQEKNSPKREKLFFSSNIYKIGLGTIFTVMAFLIRDDAFFLGSIPAFIMGIYLLSYDLVVEKGKIVKILKKYFSVFAFPAVIIFVCFFVNQNDYKDKEWDAFIRYNTIRTDLIDDRCDLLDTSVYLEELEEVGVSENDAFIYATWQFGDDSVFTPELMQKVLDINPKRPLGIAFLKALAARCYEEFYSKYVIYIAFLIVFVIAFISIIKVDIGLNDGEKNLQTKSCLVDSDKKIRVFKKLGIGKILDIVYLAANLISMAAIIFYFEYSERWSHRILGALFVAFYVCIIYFITAKDDTEYNKLVVAIDEKDNKSSLESKKEDNEVVNNSLCFMTIALLVIVNIGLCLSNWFEYNAYKRTEPDVSQVYEYIGENKDTLFILDTFTFQNINKYDLFDTFEPGCVENAMIIGSWYANSPITKQVTRKFGYENPYEALADVNGRVLLIDNLYPEQKADYLSEHYDGDYLMEKVDIKDLNQYECYTIKRQ